MQPDELNKVCDDLMELQVRRKFFIGCNNRDINAAKALVRRALGWQWDAEEQDRESVNKRAAGIVEKAMKEQDQKPEDQPVIDAIGGDLAKVRERMIPSVGARKEIEKEMVKLVKSLPVHPWQKGIVGFGELALAVIIGEAGNLSNYDQPDKLKKRLGLAPLDGKAMSTWRFEGGLTADEWSEAGYAPRRRAEIYAMMEPLFRVQTMHEGHYRQVYDRRRERTAETHADWSKLHSHRDALRVMSQELVSGLWSEWREANVLVPEKAGKPMPPADEIAA